MTRRGTGFTHTFADGVFDVFNTQIVVGSKVVVAMQSGDGQIRTGQVTAIRTKKRDLGTRSYDVTSIQIRWKDISGHGFQRSQEGKESWIEIGSRTGVMVLDGAS